MRPILSILISALALAASVPGETVYEKHCAKCHLKVISKTDTLKHPPMAEVSNQLKTHIMIKGDDEDVHRAVVIAFIKHYIENLDIMISLCNPGALDRFGQMPSLKGKLTEEEKQTVAEWLYDYYEEHPFE